MWRLLNPKIKFRIGASLLLVICLSLISFPSFASPHRFQNKEGFFQIKDSIRRVDSMGNPAQRPPFNQLPSNAVDTPPSGNRDTAVLTAATDTFSLRISKDTLDAQVDYEAEDSAVLLVKQQKFILYGKTKTTYKDVVITAPRTEIDQATNILTALGGKDSTGYVIERATFKQGAQEFESESFTFNFKTQKGITRNTFTTEGDLFIQAAVSKKVDSSTIFIRDGVFTTCNLDHPHFAFKTNRLKIISNNIAVSGPTHPEFEGVPLPIILPFGIYPLSQGRHSGLIAPQFTANQQYGLGLEGLGYYHVLNDYVDVTLRANIYSYGGWQLNISPTYRKLYRYQGSFNLGITRTKINFKGDPDFTLNKAFQINWNHSVDPKARPDTRFNASVNAGSTSYNQFIANDPTRNFNNLLTSSISYAKQPQGKPYSYTISANHNQNSSNKQINLILPDATFILLTQYPFQRSEEKAVGPARWYEKIGVGYNGTARNQVSFFDTGRVTIRNLLDTIQWGLQHRFPINLQLPPLGSFFVNPGLSYEETWFTRRLTRVWNPTLKKVDTVTASKGFFTDRSLSFNLSFNTNIYGLFQFGEKSRIRAIRHVIRPTIGMSYKPNISRRNFDIIQVDTTGRKIALAQFEGNMFPSYSYGSYGGLTFGVDNNLEMKVRGKKDTVDKKVKLLDGFGFNSGYNFLEDSFRLQPVNLYLRGTLFDKISITAQGQLDPYESSDSGLRVNRFVWQSGRFTPGRITGGSISASASFQSKPRDPDIAKKERPTISDPTVLADQQRLQDYMQRNPAEFVDFNIPWSVNLSYSLSFSRMLKPDYSGYSTTTNSGATFNNTFALTPKWNFSTNGFYDFTTSQMTMFTMSIAREMHCWQMAISVTPIGNFQYFNISISPKAGILQDLRVNRTRYFYNY